MKTKTFIFRYGCVIKIDLAIFFLVSMAHLLNYKWDISFIIDDFQTARLQFFRFLSNVIISNDIHL
jgi:hypothetical protein